MTICEKTGGPCEEVMLVFWFGVHDACVHCRKAYRR